MEILKKFGFLAIFSSASMKFCIIFVVALLCMAKNFFKDFKDFKDPNRPNRPKLHLGCSMNRNAKLYFRYGTMGSAKTALLLTSAYNFEERGIKYLCMKPVVDTRDKKNVIKSRIGIERECAWIYGNTNLYEFLQDLLHKSQEDFPAWVLVDEAQFLSAEQVDQLAAAVDDFGCNVICYGLRTDFQGHLFEGAQRLFEMADSIDEVKSTCNCGRKTIMNARIDSKGEIITEGAQVEIGGNERYVACCRKCWRNKKIESMRRATIPFDDLD